jgi:hypothetical protein
MKITRIETFTVGRLLPILLVVGVSAYRRFVREATLPWI